MKTAGYWAVPIEIERYKELLEKEKELERIRFNLLFSNTFPRNIEVKIKRRKNK